MNFNLIKLKIEYYNLKYPILKYIVLALIIFLSFGRSINFNIIIDKILYFAIFMFSVMIHEISHGITAYFFGDDTAKRSGRISLDPRVHIDLGGLMLPLFLMLVGSPIIVGSAKPVPVNEYKLKPRKAGIIIVSLAGVLSNLILAFIFIKIYTFGFVYGFLINAAIMNIGLAVFNLIPIPPLDGSNVIKPFLNYEMKRIYTIFEYNPFLSFFLILLIIRTDVIMRLVSYIFSLMI